MLFQRTIFASHNDVLQQLAHLQSEIDEVREAIEQGDLNAAADETVDVQISADTLLHILQDMGADSYGAYTRVNIKNSRRGYYGQAATVHPSE